MSFQWRQFIYSLVFLIFIIFLFNRFLDWNEDRPGIIFNDPLFQFYRGMNLSIVITSCIYSAIGFYIFYYRLHPENLSRAVLAYAIIIVLRMITIYFVPLYCDSDAVKLEDPFLNNLVYPNNYVERDLFFSGHAAMMFVLFWGFSNVMIKRIYLIIAFLVSIMLVLQKVHFSIDVIAAPFFSWIALRLTDKLLEIYRPMVN
jgi:membrane-associated phospholipid phosphatase